MDETFTLLDMVDALEGAKAIPTTEVPKVIVTLGGPIEASQNDSKVILLEEGEIVLPESQKGKRKEHSYSKLVSSKNSKSSVPSQNTSTSGITSKAIVSSGCLPFVDLGSRR
uniref:Uncharacterized protein n=1 Tax=Cannabis sativa TaxID=3483 RepID=A0A803QNF6_CANSA